MQAKQIIDLIEQRYPLYLQEEWDHSGLQMGDATQNIKKVMIALDCDLRTITEAIDHHCDMLITHHPFLFKDLNLDLNTYVGKCIYMALAHDLVIYSTHTPLDKVSMNKWLGEAIGLKDLTSCEDSHIAKKGHFRKAIAADELIARIKEAYHLEHVRVAGKREEIYSVAICGGSGGDLIDEIEADCFITGDLKYHDGEKATINHQMLIDVGHHAEVIMVEKLKAYLERHLDLDIVAGSSPDYYRYE